MKKLIYTALIGFILLNTIAYFHAYHFTHFSAANAVKTKRPSELGTLEKLKTVFLGVTNPRPCNTILPKGVYENTILTAKSGKIACWELPADTTANVNARGTVALFHGFGGAKSSLLPRSEILQKAGFNTVLIDFQGCGESDGNTTTIGYQEANTVQVVYDYLSTKKIKNLILLGNSMGSVAIVKAISDGSIEKASDNQNEILPQKIILECPFATMHRTVCARFETMGVPSFPMAALLVFWGGAQNGFWGFSHNPTEYAKTIKSPVLLLYGGDDETVNEVERQTIYDNVPSDNKKYQALGNSKHHALFSENEAEWKKEVLDFLMQ
jgi:alpha-beta hydrolase superfamily lysophospholipase